MSCEQFESSYDLYALGTLEEPEAEQLRDHLATGCAGCLDEVSSAIGRACLLSSAVPLVDPPARLRERIRQSIAPEKVNRFAFWPWAIAVLAVGVAILIAVLPRYRAPEPGQQIAAGQARVSKMLEILGAPGTVEVPLADTSERRLAGTLYVHKNLGMAMVVNQLPKLPRGWTYESWMVPKGGTPQAIEAFGPDDHGRAVTVVAGPVEISAVSAMAVSMEPLGTRPAKPTTIIFTAGV